MTVDERLFHEDRIRIPYRWPAGHLGSAFLRSLRDDTRILGSACSGCSTVYCPPRSLCLVCHRSLESMVPVGSEGTLLTPSTDGLGLIMLDGATTALLHRVGAALGPGDRVRAEWASERTGSILDLAGFSPTGSKVSIPATYGIPYKRSGSAPRFLEPIAIVGIACTPAGADRTGWSFAEMVHEVVEDVFAQTGADHGLVDTVVTASSDFLDGRTISDMALQDVVGAPGKSCSKVSQDGLFALLYAAARITSGAFKTALVVAHAKSSEGDPRLISQAAFDPIYVRPLGLTDQTLIALQAGRYWTGPLGQSGTPPVRRSPNTDTAVALLLANVDVARRLKGRRAWLAGAGFATQTHAPGERDLGTSVALSHAAGQAFERAGIRPEQLGVAEFSDLGGLQDRQWPEAAGVKTGHVSSGPHSTGFATGLERLAAVWRQAPAYGLAHAVGGYVGQNHAVWIVRSE